MRRDAAYLADILEACKAIKAICAGRDANAVESDPVLRAAVLHHLTVVGEAASRLTPGFRNSHDEMPWPQIVAQRHRIVHGYFGLDWDVLWVSATEDVPELLAWAERVLASEFPEEDAHG